MPGATSKARVLGWVFQRGHADRMGGAVFVVSADVSGQPVPARRQPDGVTDSLESLGPLTTNLEGTPGVMPLTPNPSGLLSLPTRNASCHDQHRPKS